MINALPTANYKVFEDNQSFIAVAESKKPLARTKHVATKYHHFRGLVDKGIIKINYVDTKKQMADTLTKPIENNQFFKLRCMIMGW